MKNNKKYHAYDAISTFRCKTSTEVFNEVFKLLMNLAEKFL